MILSSTRKKTWRPLAVDDVFEDDRTVEPDWWLRHELKSSYSMPVLDGDRLLAVRRGQAFRSSEDILWQQNGQTIPVEWVLTPLFQDGTTIGAVMTFRDISREKEAERQRSALAQSEKLRALGQLAGGVAHDLNQSLGLVVGHSELALEAIGQAPGPSEELRESLETIMQGAMDGAQTVNRLQTFVRGQPEGEAERIAVGDLLADVARLTAPRRRDAAQAAGAPVNVSVNVAMAGERDLAATRPRTILIVDDEAALRRMLTRMLQIDGHTVVAAATAAEAIHHLRKQRFDLVLSDHGLGMGMNGLELAAAVRDVWPGTRFILVTAWGGSIDPAEVEPLGVEAVIGKPYRAPELRERINARP